jgi:hypothetical protein
MLFTENVAVLFKNVRITNKMCENNADILMLKHTAHRLTSVLKSQNKIKIQKLKKRSE